MFIKKDLRKIPQILSDAAEDDAPRLTELRLARRPAEFSGSITVLTQPHYAPTLEHLVSLSLYDCQISNLDGIGFFASPISMPMSITIEGDADGDGDTRNSTSTSSMICCPNLTHLNLGKNPLSVIPQDLGLMSKSLTHLWLDDCQISGPIPNSIYELTKLHTLRISNNQITELKGEGGIDQWKDMEVLCLDGNQIENVPKEVMQMTKLRMLLLRNNKIQSLPEGVPGPTHKQLTLFHISSNQLTTLPSSIGECPALTTIYANANRIKRIPSALDALDQLKSLESCNLSNNQIGASEVLTNTFIARFGEPDKYGKCEKDKDDGNGKCCIQLEQNEVVKRYNPDDDVGGSSTTPMEVC